MTVGTLTRANQPAGAGSVAFSGRIGRHALKPGGYKAALGAVNTKGRSPAVSLAFTIVR